MNIVIPMAGQGSRFEQAGYTLPKPLIDINGKPMIQLVVESINVNANYIFLVQRTHYEQYNLGLVLNTIAPNCTILQVDGITEGAACSVLLAAEYINNDTPLIIANSDQYINWNPTACLDKFSKFDAGILTFNASSTKWSYAKTNEQGLVMEVAEKVVISDQATVGIYYWKHGKDFVKYANQMIDKNIRVNNEFYVCPVFNEAIQDNKQVVTSLVDTMWGLGTPEDLEIFLQR
jgi:dTDP-glucose pyrophosphorylase